MKHYDVIILGGGPAGRVVVHELHQAKEKKNVLLIKDEGVNVNRCAVPFGINGEKALEKYLISNALVTDFGAELIVDRVQSVDPSKRTVCTEKGLRAGFTDLVFATGARPFIPELDGIAVGNIFSVRTKGDLEQLRGAAKEAKRAVIIGAGFIGVETAVVLRRMGLDVQLVSKYPLVMQPTGESELLGAIQEDLLSHGVEIRAPHRAQSFETTGNVAYAVTLENGETLEADFFVVALGVAPNIELAAQAGIKSGRLGIEVDERLQTNYPNIYAAGDCAEKRSFVSGLPIKGEFGTNAVFMSRVVSANLLGKNEVFQGVLNASGATSFTLGFGSAGLTEAQASAHGIDAVSGYSEVLDKYPMMEHASQIKTKLVFERQNGRLIGGSVVRNGSCAANNVDFISLGIQLGATMESLLRYQYATHPELAAKPSDNMYVFAARDARAKL